MQTANELTYTLQKYKRIRLIAAPGVVKFMELYDKSSEIITSSTPGTIIQAEQSVHIKKKSRNLKLNVKVLLMIWNKKTKRFQK